MSKQTILAIVLLAAVIALGGWKAVRGAIARQAVHELLHAAGFRTRF